MIRAVLFDLGGTLYDYASLEPGNRASLQAARAALLRGHEEGP